MGKESGQTLVALMAFMAMAVTITSAATIITVASLQATSVYSLGEQALDAAESGADNAVLRLIRNPDYSGETLDVDGAVAIISVSGSAPTKTITSQGVVGDFRRTVQVSVNQSGNTVTVTNWTEMQ